MVSSAPCDRRLGAADHGTNPLEGRKESIASRSVTKESAVRGAGGCREYWCPQPAVIRVGGVLAAAFERTHRKANPNRL